MELFIIAIFALLFLLLFPLFVKSRGNHHYQESPDNEERWKSNRYHNRSRFDGGKQQAGNRIEPPGEGYVGFKKSLASPDAIDTVGRTRKNTVATIQEALQRQTSLTFRYEKESGEVSFRNVRPIDVYLGYKNRYYLKAYDNDRRENRSFRLDRMSSIELK